MFGTVESEFGGVEFLGGALLFAVGENKAEGGTEERGGDGQPGDEELFLGDAAAHENNEERNAGGKDMRDDEIGEAGMGLVNGTVSGPLPGGGENNHEQIGQGPEEIAPAGRSGIGAECEEIVAIGEASGKEDSHHGGREVTEPGRERGSGAKDESGSEKKIPDDVDDENLAEKVSVVGLPSGRDVEEIEIGGGGDDGDLKKVEDAKPVDGGRVVVGRGEKHHEDGNSPDEEQKIGRQGNLGGAGNETLEVGADGLSDGFERQGDGEKNPELTGIARGATSDVEGTNGGEKDHSEVQSVGVQKAFGGGLNGFDVEDEENGHKDRGSHGEPGKLAGKEQEASEEEVLGESVHEKGSGDQ